MTKYSSAAGRFIAVAFMLMVSACNQNPIYQEGIQNLQEGRVEQGLAKLEQASKESPGNAEYRSAYYRQREAAVTQFLMQAEAARNSGDLAGAEASYRRVLGIDAANGRAAQGLEVVAAIRRHRLLVDQAEALMAKKDLVGAEDRVRLVLSENPANREARGIQQRIDEIRLGNRLAAKTLKSDLRRPITLDFRDASIRNVFEAISRASGVSYVFDRDVRPDLRVTIQLRNKSIEDAVRVLLATNQLEQKILDDDIVIVYPNVPAKQREYQELTVKAFYLANADVKQVLNSIRTVVKTRDIYFDERLNALIMRDTPEAIRAAEKLVALQDRAEPEVVLQLEVMEVSTARLQELGIRFPEQVSASAIGAAGIAGTITLPEWQNRDSSLVRLSITNPALILNLKRLDSETNLLANPHVRVRNREKARIHIGTRVPVVTTTSTANVGVSESINYLDVGLKLELEPNIYLDDEVAMRVGLEVSSIVREEKSASNNTVYFVGTRNAATTLRLRDGETQILAGLIQNDERNSVDKIPGLSDLPLIGRLFSNRRDDRTKTEIVLLITPRIVRNIVRPDAGVREFAIGTESMGSGISGSVQFGPMAPPPVFTPAPKPAAPGGAGSPPAFTAPSTFGAPGGSPLVFPQPQPGALPDTPSAPPAAPPRAPTVPGALPG
ncbi:MAG TPA: secretin N-terminal domain-containing protein [Burkholderiales bacterium]|nr:secretin N-terminal domain-containing protein [Burkholderiales bacterium]